MVNLDENLIIIGFDEQLLMDTLSFLSSTFYTILDELTLPPPPNIYPKDWDKISQKYKEQVNWQCEAIDCKHRDLSSLQLRKYLHCHHIDMKKNNTRNYNLKALCILCHAKEPNHAHLKNTPNYSEYKSLINS